MGSALRLEHVFLMNQLDVPADEEKAGAKSLIRRYILIEAYGGDGRLRHITLLEVKERNDGLDTVYRPGVFTSLQKTPGCRAQPWPPASRSRQRRKIQDAFGRSAQGQAGVLLLPRVFHTWTGRSRPDRRLLICGNPTARLGVEILLNAPRGLCHLHP